jgi:predicted acylesterase/phospholipase RssA
MSKQIDLIKKVNYTISQATVGFEEVRALIKELKNIYLFDYAQKLINHAITHKNEDITTNESLILSQELALCTYKDVNLSQKHRLKLALNILDTADPIDETDNLETLGLAGAIHKREWEVFNKKESLELSLVYYYRGYELSVKNEWTCKDDWKFDNGYTAINAAFILDRLGYIEIKEAKKAHWNYSVARNRIDKAKTIRKNISSNLSNKLDKLEGKWWDFVTLSEALFGLCKYDEANAWLDNAKKLPSISEWEIESTSRQLAQLLNLQIELYNFDDKFMFPNFNEGKARSVLTKLIGNDEAVESVITGKVGIALSGGGFRASLYHIGVLARFAELDLLRKIETISCVSGGSIIGAYYYLELKTLLEAKMDAAITQQDYIELIKRIEKEFLEGVQSNIRTRVLSSIASAFKTGRSRTIKLAELYEQQLFDKINGCTKKQNLFMNDLSIKPKGEEVAFLPKFQNWKRKAKIPTLILNATNLNTGHNWHFTTSSMGEPASTIDLEIDSNDHFPCVSYTDLKNKIRLGEAVAASSCVPGLFPPLELKYSDIMVQLVDGGVYDNQGTVGLLEQNCTVLLVSDASGQMQTQNEASTDVLNTSLRTSSILQTRVRSAQFKEIEARLSSGLLNNLMYIHLKKDLKGNTIRETDATSSHQSKLTEYNINKKYQDLLSKVRTDLDSFTDNEAHALMFSGYQMTSYYSPQILKPRKIESIEWRFMRMVGILTNNVTEPKWIAELEISQKLTFKMWRVFFTKILNLLLSIPKCILALSVLITFVLGIYKIIQPNLFDAVMGLIILFISVVVAVSTAPILQTLMRLVFVSIKKIIKTTSLVVVALPMKLHILLDQCYLYLVNKVKIEK